MKYHTNFVKTENGNGIEGGKDLIITLEDVDYASGAIYHNGFPVIPDFDDNKDGKVELVFRLLERVNGQYQSLPKDDYVLKVRAYKDGKGGNGIDDKFIIL